MRSACVSTVYSCPYKYKSLTDNSGMWCTQGNVGRILQRTLMHGALRLFSVWAQTPKVDGLVLRLLGQFTGANSDSASSEGIINNTTNKVSFEKQPMMHTYVQLCCTPGIKLMQKS